jgi:hypothetical protein
MTNFWSLFVAHWELSLISWLFGNFTASGVFLWFYPNRKEWRAERQEKAEKNLEAEVLKMLGDGRIWKAANIAGTLGRDRETTRTCLEDLVMRGRLQKGGGTFDDAAPDYWSLE